MKKTRIWSKSVLCVLVNPFIFGVAFDCAAAEKTRAVNAIPGFLKGFKGMMTGTLVKKGESSFTFKGSGIKKVWKANTAKHPEKAVGMTLTLNLNRISAHHRKKILKNYAELKNGDEIELEAFDLGDRTLSVMEWLKKTGGI